MTSQNAFRAGLLDPSQPAPDGLSDGHGNPAGKRYDVYRNNVSHSLIEAMNTAFPFVRKLIGAKRFSAIAPSYVRAHPPKAPMMMYYGDDFPDFIASVPELEDFGYLKDAARLDLAIRSSYHAADAAPFDPDVLTRAPEGIMALRFSLAPATRIIRSPWPLYDIWRFTMVPGSPKPRAVAQDVIVTRPEFDPDVHLLPAGAANWLMSLNEGVTFGAAIEAAGPDFELEPALGLALQNHVFVSTE